MEVRCHNDQEELMGIFKKNVKENIAAVEAEIARWERNLQGLRERQKAAEQQAADLESERQKHIVSALAEGDGTAQAKIDGLQKEKDQALQRQRDCALAVSEVERKLKSLRSQLAVAQQEFQKEQFRAAAPKARAKATAIAEIMTHLRQEISGFIAIRSEMADAVHQLREERLGSVVTSLSRPGEDIWAFVKKSLSDILPVNTDNSYSQATQSLEAWEEKQFARALEAIEALPLGGAPADPEVRLYEVKQSLGLKGLMHSIGDTVRLRPDEAQEWVDQRILEEGILGLEQRGGPSDNHGPAEM
jgi:chromosome segregation ATPase